MAEEEDLRLSDLLDSYDGGKVLSDVEIRSLLSKLRTTQVRKMIGGMHISFYITTSPVVQLLPFDSSSID